MNTWIKIRKKCVMIETCGIVGIIFSFIIGAYCDWNVIVNQDILIVFKDIESFSLTLLQIQATISTLIVAIVALIAGSISDSYMGVSISNYYLSIRPWILKQKVLFFISLALCLFGIISYSFKWYNIIFSSFLDTLIIISISIIEVYSAFKGRNIINTEIELYIKYILESNVIYEKKVYIYQNFVLDWKSNIEVQDRESYIRFYEIFQKCMYALWEYEKSEVLKDIQHQCYSMLYCFLGSERNLIKERGIEFIQNIYDSLWEVLYQCINDEKPIINRFEKNFSLFSEINMDLIQSIDDLNIVAPLSA